MTVTVTMTVTMTMTVTVTVTGTMTAVVRGRTTSFSHRRAVRMTSLCS